MAAIRLLLPYVCLALYSFGNALVTGVGRVGMGTEQALASRYTTMDVPLWVSLPAVLLILAGGRGRVALAAQWLFRCTVVLLILGSALSIQGAARLSRIQALGRDSLLRLAQGTPTLNDYRALFGLYPDTQVVLQRYWVLKDHRLSCFREPEIAPP